MIKNMLAAVAIMSYSALAQIGFGTGTVIIFNRTEDKLIVAADSRENHRESNRPPDDTYCKITAFGDQIVFTSVGVDGASGTLAWNNIDVAASVIHSARSNGRDFRLYDVVVAWGNSMMQNWRAAYLLSPATVVMAAEQNDGGLTAGMFAQVKNGKIYWEGAAITFDRSRAEPVGLIVGQMDTCWACGEEGSAKICAGGKVAVATKFCAQHAPDIVPSKSLLDRIGKEGVLAIRIADLTVAYDRSGEVGGHIDAVELNRNGSIRWLARKDNCPENHD